MTSAQERPLERHRDSLANVLWPLFLLVFCVCALSGPGRIDIVDGQTRYEVARSIVDHGDHSVRDPRVSFAVFEGRDGLRFSSYRFPQTFLGVPAVWLADLTGPNGEPRRRFFFSLTSAFAGAILAVFYACAFLSLGHSASSAVVWALGGIFCTPNWFYATSTFDEILGSAALVGALAGALWCRQGGGAAGAIGAGLMLGLAFNCKQPLSVFALPVIAASHEPAVPMARQRFRTFLIVAGLGLGIFVYQAYDTYKFPDGFTPEFVESLQAYAPILPGNPAAALLALSLSPAAGTLWYWPASVIALLALAVSTRLPNLSRLSTATIVSSLLFVAFLSVLTIFKGDPSWGPRYLTPMFAVWWLFMPEGVRLVKKHAGVAVLALSALIQVAGLSVDPHRLYVERQLHSAFYVIDPWRYLDPGISHLFNRPREVLEILKSPPSAASEFSPAPEPTFAPPLLEEIVGGRAAVRRYAMLDSFRPWWVSQQALTKEDRPVNIPRTAILLLIGAVGSTWLLAVNRRSV